MDSFPSSIFIMFKKSLVIVDLETSGVDPKVNDIIEIAVIRYENGKEVGRFSSLVKINYKLSPIITAITAITDDEIKQKGRPLKEVLEEAMPLLQNAYVMGHNVNFDVGFLKKAGVKLNELGLIDTLPLAQIAFPQNGSYSLEVLSDALGIAHENSHRAMSDVEATLDLFKCIWDVFCRLPEKGIEVIAQAVSRSTWECGVIFEEIKGHSGKFVSPVIPVELVKNISVSPLKPLEIDTLFNEKGVMQRVFEGHEYRPQQIEMAQNVMNAFRNRYHLICEAPTGVGKSMAYLSAAFNIAISNKSKVVISTNTINLQQQLYEKDVPLLRELYMHETHHPGPRVALLKGRSHYLCLRRLAEFKRRTRFNHEEIVLLIKILVWQYTTSTGDSSEIYLTRPETMIWDFELCSDKRFCSPQKCKPYGECFLHQARKIADESDIIIVNHALLCADLTSDGSLLPEYHYLVIDEAHHFEETATNAFGIGISEESTVVPIKAIQNHLDDFQRRHAKTLFGSDPVFESIEVALGTLPDLFQLVENFFSIVALFVNRNVSDSGYIEKLLIDRVILGTSEWLNLSSSVDDVSHRLNEWIKPLRSLLDRLLLVQDNAFPDQDVFVDELLQEIEILKEQITHLSLFFKEETASSEVFVDHQIRWMSSDLNGHVAMHMAPLLVGPKLQKILYQKKRSIILTSATLGIQLHQNDSNEPAQHPFAYLRKMLGLDETFEELILTSPFDFESQAYVLLPTDSLAVNHRDSMGQVGRFFSDLISKVHGGILGLFTSYSSIETLYLDLMNRPEIQQTRLLAQRISGGRSKVMKAYLNDPERSVLLGTSSFWEGIDIQGEALTVLVIHKIPFDVPSDPIFAARSELFTNSFMEYSIPRAILRFKQGFGRLIRSTKDYGALIILDNRVLSKEYGQLFLKALPDNITTEKIPLSGIPSKVSEWLTLSRENTKD